MARDFWMTKRLAVRVDKIKKSITIPAATYNCGPTNASLYVPSTTVALYTGGTPFSVGSINALSIDFRLNQFDNPSVNNYIIVQLLSSSGNFIKLLNNGGVLRLEVQASGGAVTSNTTRTLPFHSWARYTITFSSTDNRCKLYVNNELILSLVTTGNMGADDYILAFGDAPNQSYVIGHIQDVALYSRALDQESIYNTETHRGNVGVYGSGLTAYWKLRSNFADSLGNAPDLETTDPLASFTTDEYAPIKFGASFVVAQAEFSLGTKCSLRFPNTPPEGTTGLFIVRWTDEDGEVQRRKLWSLDGVDVDADDYRGEAVTDDFVLELWNVDGNDTVILPEDIVFRISKTTNPTTSYDTTAQAAAEVTVNSELAAPFPLVFPIVFDTQQTY